MKELFIAAHEELIEEYLEAHPESDWADAYEKTSDAAYVRFQDKCADLCDALAQIEATSTDEYAISVARDALARVEE